MNDAPFLEDFEKKQPVSSSVAVHNPHAAVPSALRADDPINLTQEATPHSHTLGAESVPADVDEDDGKARKKKK